MKKQKGECSRFRYKLKPFFFTKAEKEPPPAQLSELWPRIISQTLSKRLLLFCSFFVLLAAKFTAATAGIKVSIPGKLILIVGFWYLATFPVLHELRKKSSRTQAEFLYTGFFIFEAILVVCLTHWTGGVAWIGPLFFIPILIYAHMNLARENRLIVSLVVIFLFLLLAFLEYSALLPPERIFNLTAGTRNRTYAIYTVLTTAAMCGVFYIIIRAAGIFSTVLKERANTDGLTSLWNHRYFQESLEKEINRAKRYARQLSLIMADIDWFKNYNDTYGHPKGDIVLKEIARIITASIRQTDLAARYGGEEIAIILPETDKKQATKVAERTRQSVETYLFPGNPADKVTITLSCGVATYPDDADDRPGLIGRADHALYQAKQQGRNRVQIA